MGVSINGKPITSATVFKAKRSGHTKAKAPTISLDQPGRLRVAHLMALLSISHSSLYERLRTHVVPKPDGHDPRPYWKTETVRLLLQE
jgi:hypothetical protein